MVGGQGLPQDVTQTPGEPPCCSPAVGLTRIPTQFIAHQQRAPSPTPPQPHPQDYLTSHTCLTPGRRPSCPPGPQPEEAPAVVCPLPMCPRLTSEPRDGCTPTTLWPALSAPHVGTPQPPLLPMWGGAVPGMGRLPDPQQREPPLWASVRGAFSPRPPRTRDSPALWGVCPTRPWGRGHSVGPLRGRGRLGSAGGTCQCLTPHAWHRL